MRKEVRFDRGTCKDWRVVGWQFRSSRRSWVESEHFTNVFDGFCASGCAIGESRFDRLTDIQLFHEVVPATGFGQLVDELTGDRFGVLGLHNDPE